MQYKSNLNLEDSKKFLTLCQSVCRGWSFEKLDARESFARQVIFSTFVECSEQMSFSEVLDYASIPLSITQPEIFWGVDSWEVGFRTDKKGIDYFLFMRIENDKFITILEKYKTLIVNF